MVGTVMTTVEATGIIYSANSVVTTANVFNNFPAGGALLRVFVGAYDDTLPLQAFEFPATLSTYTIPANGTTPPTAPLSNIVIPSQFVKDSSAFDIAAVKLPMGPQFMFNFSNPEIAIANFPTSTPIASEPLFAVAYGNQNPGGPNFPLLKFAKLNLKRNTLCAQNLTGNGVTRRFTYGQNFCMQSPVNASAAFEGVCGQDIGGAIVRTTEINTNGSYYEVVGLISYANDSTTCNPTKPVPVIVSYLATYQAGFFNPVLGTLAAAGNKQNPASNPNSPRGNFFCGDGILQGSEDCEFTTPETSGCCNTDLCQFQAPDTFCSPGKNATALDRCLTKFRCSRNGECARRFRNGRKCPNGFCLRGVCQPNA
jgi:hypothetical protein